MTDAEKELRRLAEGAKSGLVMSLYPVTVLALLNRIEALENMLAKKELEAVLGPALDVIREPLIELGSTFPGGGLIGIAEGIREVVRNAERKGAEEMRERAAIVHDGQCASQGFSGLSTAPWHRRYAAEIRRLPLPGDST